MEWLDTGARNATACGRFISPQLLDLGLVIVWLIINPFVFPRPVRVNNWMSKGVIGEKMYFEGGKKLRRDLPTLLNLTNVPLFIAFIYFGWQQALVPLILTGLLVMVIKFWFIDRMVRLVDDSQRGVVTPS